MKLTKEQFDEWVEELTQYSGYAAHEGQRVEIVAFCELAKLGFEKAARPEARWIDVNERLPKDKQDCLIYEVGHGCLGPIRWVEKDRAWLDLFATYEAGMIYFPKTAKDGQVTHWSPLPTSLPQSHQGGES